MVRPTALTRALRRSIAQKSRLSGLLFDCEDFYLF